MLFLYEGKLNDLDMVIAKAIDSNPEIIIDNTIFEAADIIGVSASKLTKFCQKINLSGFKEIKFRLEQELQNKKYLTQNVNIINIKSVINIQYHHRIFDVPPLLINAQKIIIVSNSDYYYFARYIAGELRRILKVDCTSYISDQDFSFEYLDEGVLTIFIDEHGKIDCMETKWYRRGNKYVQISMEKLSPQNSFYPICVSDVELDYSFDVKLLIILSWIKSLGLKMDEKYD